MICCEKPVDVLFVINYLIAHETEFAEGEESTVPRLVRVAADLGFFEGPHSIMLAAPLAREQQRDRVRPSTHDLQPIHSHISNNELQHLVARSADEVHGLSEFDELGSLEDIENILDALASF